MSAKQRGGKRYATKKVTPGGKSKRPSYMIEVVETYMKIDGKAHSSSYSIKRHGVRRANQMADAWLVEKRELAAKADARRAS